MMAGRKGFLLRPVCLIKMYFFLYHYTTKQISHDKNRTPAPFRLLLLQ